MRSYSKDYKEDYPIGIILKEPKKERQKANKLEKKLSEYSTLNSIIGGIAGGALLGIPAYTVSRAYNNSSLKSLGIGALAALPGFLVGKSVGPLLPRYMKYRKLAKENNKNVGTFNYALLDEGGQVARLLGKSDKDILKYQALNSQLKASDLIGGGALGTVAAAPVLAAGLPVTAGITKVTVSDLAGNYLKDKTYNTLITVNNK